MAFELTDANFQQEVLEKKGITLIDFWAEWCGPCRAIAPTIEELSNEYKGQVLVAKVDVDTNADLSMKYDVRSIPTLLILKDGVVVEKVVGGKSKAALKKLIDTHLVPA